MATEVESAYAIQEVCKLTGLSPRIMTKLFERELGAVVSEQPNPHRKRRSTDQSASPGVFMSASCTVTPSNEQRQPGAGTERMYTS